MAYQLLTVLIQMFFFFQAEDGIRDTSVTGVQTCALPITLRALVGSSNTTRARLFPLEGNDCAAMMFTLRSASARQILPSVPGLSSIVRVNSLTTGILRTSLSSSGAGRDASSRLDRGRTTWYSPALPSCKNGLCG